MIKFLLSVYGGKKRGFIDIRASIYIAKFDGKIATKVEKNDVIWVDAKDYKDKLYFEHQRYILDNYINKKNKKGKF